MRFAALVCGVLFFAVLPAHGDGLPSYDITGWFTITGNNVCGGVCSETVNVSFIASYSQFIPGENVLTISDSMFSATGNLGTFSGAGPTEIGNPGATGYLAYFLGSDELDLNLTNTIESGTAPPGYGSSIIYTCASSTCIADFSSPANPTIGAYVGIGSRSLTSTPIPEPSSLLLLLAGLSLVFITLGWNTIRR